jgi:Domain of unknown function (DUF2828)
MAALINAIDSNNTFLNDHPIQHGEKGHAEYTWSTNIKEKILQFSFQVVRTTKETRNELAWKLREILTTLSKCENGNLKSEFLTIMYKICAHTRDIVDGKGEYDLTYMQIFLWYDFWPELAKFALLKCMTFADDVHPYGSWKDIKYFCEYCRIQGAEISHPLIQYAVKITNEQLAKDDLSVDKKSLCAKWIPREKCRRFGWLFKELALHYFSHYLTTGLTFVSIQRAHKKCFMEYRKIVSRNNAFLDTVQIKQCAKTWAVIDHSKTTSITIAKQKRAFLNVKKDGTQRSELEDRIQCAEAFKNRIRLATEGKVSMKGKRVGLNNFTVQAMELLRQTPSEIVQQQIDLLNAQWRDNATQTEALKAMIPMVDFSGSMDGDPRDCAFALGIRVAEKSVLGKRVLSFSDNPTWHSLENCENFVDCVKELQRGEVGYSTKFYNALKVILDAIVEKGLTQEDISGLTLAIFSDMQMDQAEGNRVDTDTLYKKIETLYAETGVRVCGTPYKPPHILFWNLRSTSGFPALSSQKNVSMVSGFSPALLNLFCENGVSAFESCTPWSNLGLMLDNERYQCMAERVQCMEL